MWLPILLSHQHLLTVSNWQCLWIFTHRQCGDRFFWWKNWEYSMFLWFIILSLMYLEQRASSFFKSIAFIIINLHLFRLQRNSRQSIHTSHQRFNFSWRIFPSNHDQFRSDYFLLALTFAMVEKHILMMKWINNKLALFYI